MCFSTVDVLAAAQQTQNICITFIQRRHNVFDVGPTLYTCYTNALFLLEVISFCNTMIFDLTGFSWTWISLVV